MNKGENYGILLGFQIAVYRCVSRAPSVIKRVKGEALHKRMVAGSAEGGLERLGAHR